MHTEVKEKQKLRCYPQTMHEAIALSELARFCVQGFQCEGGKQEALLRHPPVSHKATKRSHARVCTSKRTLHSGQKKAEMGKRKEERKTRFKDSKKKLISKTQSTVVRSKALTHLHTQKEEKRNRRKEGEKKVQSVKAGRKETRKRKAVR